MQLKEKLMRIKKKDNLRENTLIFEQILSTNPVRKCMEIRWESLYAIEGLEGLKQMVFAQRSSICFRYYLKADTDEGFCSRSMLQGHAPVAKLLRVYQGVHGYTSPSGAKFPPRKMLHDI